MSSLRCRLAGFFVSAQQNLLPSICSAASFYVLKKIAERVGGLLAYAELLREHFFGQRANSINGKRLIDNFYPSTRLRHESTIPDSRLKPSSKPSQAYIMSSSSDNELPLFAAEPRTPEKQPPPPPPPPPAPKRRRGKGKAKRDDGVASQHFKLTDAERDLFVDYLRERPFMYEKKDKDYKDALRRKREWEACANLVGRTVELLQGWLKSRRSMLGKARSIKSKSGSCSEPLPPSLQWVYDNLSFMSAGAGVLHSETLGPRKDVPGSPFADEADLEEPGPSKRPRHATPSSSASRAHSSTPLERQSRVHEWPSSKSPTCTSAEKCCGHLCTQLDEMHQHLRDIPKLPNEVDVLLHNPQRCLKIRATRFDNSAQQILRASDAAGKKGRNLKLRC